VFGVSSNPYLLNSTIQHHEKYSSSHPELVAKLLESFYVDDLVCGGNNDEDAYEHYSFAKDILSQALFNLLKFVTLHCLHRPVDLQSLLRCPFLRHIKQRPDFFKICFLVLTCTTVSQATGLWALPQ